MAIPGGSHAGPVRPFADRAGRVAMWLIHRGLSLAGRRVRLAAHPWLDGPLGGRAIGGGVYARHAAEAGLLVIRDAPDAGLLERFGDLRGGAFDPDRVAPEIADFYEHTARYDMDVWLQWTGPLRCFANLLVYLVGPLMEQFNLPASPLAFSTGVSSEVARLVDPRTGRLAYAGWLRRNAGSHEVIYAGFYTICTPPGAGVPCVKVVFPVTDGASTVILRPQNAPDGGLRLVSHGKRFGDPGFYRLHRGRRGRVRVAYLPLTEVFHLHLGAGSIRTDHELSFLGLKFLTLRYRIRPIARD